MAPTVGRIGSIKIMIYSRDHEPAHLHAIDRTDNSEVIMDLNGNVIRNHGFSERDIRALKAYVLKNKDLLQEVWNDYHEE